MGGCASKPKEFIKSADPPIKSKKPQPETTAQENTDAGENKTKKPSVEVSETVGSGGEPVSSKDGDDKAASKNDNDTIEPVKKAEVDPESSSKEAKRNEPIKEE